MEILLKFLRKTYKHSRCKKIESRLWEIISIFPFIFLEWLLMFYFFQSKILKSLEMFQYALTLSAQG